jgi:hypothetical protein
MADRTAISTRICSQLKRVRTIDGDSDVDHDLRDLCFLSKSVFKHPARPQSSRGGSSRRRSSPGSHPDTSAPPILICTPNLGRGLGPGSHLAVLPAHSLRSSALSRLETLCADDTSTAGSSTALHATLRALRPSPRPDGSTYGTHGGVTGSHGRKSPTGVTGLSGTTHGRKSPLGIRAGDSIPGDSSIRSRSRCMLSRNGSRSQGSLSSCAGSQSGRVSSHANRLETPPGNPNAHEAHRLLVRCPAPRRPPLYAVDRKSRWHLDTFSTDAF